jgi:hypothetical protein
MYRLASTIERGIFHCWTYILTPQSMSTEANLDKEDKSYQTMSAAGQKEVSKKCSRMVGCLAGRVLYELDGYGMALVSEREPRNESKWDVRPASALLATGQNGDDCPSMQCLVATPAWGEPPMPQPIDRCPHLC